MNALATPALVLAADHRARGVIVVEEYHAYLHAVREALAHCDGLLASLQPLVDLVRDGAAPGRALYLSINRTGLADSVFELDDRQVATVRRAAAEGCTGIKVMVRIDTDDPRTAAGLELVGRVLDEARHAGLDAMVETMPWRADAPDHDVDAVVRAAVIVHDMGAPLLKVPCPHTPPGSARSEAVARVVRAVGVPVLFLGGPRTSPVSATAGDDEGLDGAGAGAELLSLARDVMAGGGAGMAVGRGLLEHPDPAAMADTLAAVVHGR